MTTFISQTQKIESLIIVKENMAMVEVFVKNGVYEYMKKSDCNPFENIALEQTDREPE